jgi:hypothetical protein
MSMKRATRVKKINLAKLKKEVWQLVSIAIRLRDADVHGQVTCISCNYTGYYIRDKIQAGHFFQSRNFQGVRWNFDNIHGQCQFCNGGRQGNVYRYYTKLKEKIGQNRIDKLNNNADEKIKETIDFILEVKEMAIKIIAKNAKEKNIYDWKQLITKKEINSWPVNLT